MKRFLITFTLGMLTPIVVVGILAARGRWPVRATATPTDLETALLIRYSGMAGWDGLPPAVDARWRTKPQPGTD